MKLAFDEWTEREKAAYLAGFGTATLVMLNGCPLDYLKTSLAGLGQLIGARDALVSHLVGETVAKMLDSAAVAYEADDRLLDLIRHAAGQIVMPQRGS